MAGANYKTPNAIDPLTDASNWTPAEFKEKYIVRRYDFRYDSGGFLDDLTPPDTDITMSHRVDVYVIRKLDNWVILKNTAVISRDGMF